MKILQIDTDGASGGRTHHVMQLLQGLDNSFHQRLLTQQDSHLSEQAHASGIAVRTGEFCGRRLQANNRRQLRAVIGEFQPDIIHCHGGRAALAMSFIRTEVPTVYTVDGFHYAHRAAPWRLAGWLAGFWTARRCDRIIFGSHYDQCLAIESNLLPGDVQYEVIHNGIAAPPVEKSKGELGVGFIGRLDHQKRPEMFLEVMKRLPQVQGTLVGGGKLEAEVRQRLKDEGLDDRVKMLGALAHADALKVISKLDVLVMTSRWEGLPLLPLEAMSLGVPVVSTPVGGVPEVVDHEFTGLLGESPEELAGHVQALLNDPDLYEWIVTNAESGAADRFGEARMLRYVSRCYVDLFQESVWRSQLAQAPESIGV